MKKRIVQVLVALLAGGVIAAAAPGAAHAAPASCTPVVVKLVISGVNAHEYMPFCRFPGGFQDAFEKVNVKMQTDGNLVVYSTGSGAHALWASNTSGNPGAYLDMQTDGNLVIYTGNPRRSIWSSHTAGKANAFLAVQGDGNIVVYQKTQPGGGLKVLWSPNTAY
jgi:hypothetical protein